MKTSLKMCFILIASLILSCNKASNTFETTEGKTIRNKVDKAVIGLDTTISNFKKVLRIDHSRLAEAEGVYTPPSVVTIFTNPEVNSQLLKINPLVGIDLPYKVLCYSEPDLKKVQIAYTSPEFIIKRHGLNQSDLTQFSDDISAVIQAFPKEMISHTDLYEVNEGYGLIIKKSDYDFNKTLENLKSGIKEQGDTEIFGEIDYKNEALAFDITLSPTTLILFGAPKPGGQAMYKCPKIGLDAFCQKLLVFEKANEVFIAYNDILKFSELYYDTWTVPQRVINHRLNSVFEESITE